jgi:hypothetical protein
MTTNLINANTDGRALARTEHGAVELAFEDDGGGADRDDDPLDEDDNRGTPNVRSGDPASDQVIGLREWGTRWMFPLRRPSLPAAESATALQLSRGNLTVAANRVELVHEGRFWRVKDWDAVAELKQDGNPAREVSLLPGMEVSIAGRLFVAESARTIALRNFCSRLLGWGDDQLSTIDQALRAIRLAASGRAVLMLRGSGDLVHVAQTIHRYAAKEGTPFIVSDPRRQAIAATVRSPANFPLGLDAFHRARQGLQRHGMSSPWLLPRSRFLRSKRVPCKKWSGSSASTSRTRSRCWELPRTASGLGMSRGSWSAGRSRATSRSPTSRKPSSAWSPSR